MLDAVAKAGDVGKSFALLPEHVSTTVVAVGIRKNEASLKTAVNEALSPLESSGQAEKIFFTWYGPSTRHQPQHPPPAPAPATSTAYATSSSPR